MPSWVLNFHISGNSGRKVFFVSGACSGMAIGTKPFKIFFWSTFYLGIFNFEQGIILNTVAYF